MSEKKDNTRWGKILITTWMVVSFAAPSAGSDDYVNKQSDYPRLVPDTGQTRCYDNRREIPCPRPGEPFYGQDGNYSINAPVYTLKDINGVEILKDEVTGLSWQRIPDGTGRTWSEAIDYTDDLTLAGLTGWRLPQKQELQSVLSYGTTPSPLLEPAEGQKNGMPGSRICAWTLTTRVFPSRYAKKLCLDDNQGAISDKYEKNFVYAVQGPTLPYGSFQDNGNGTITDLTTGLMWQAGEIRSKKWQEALAYCRELELGGFQDWRLPTIRELSTLVDENRIDPSINTTFFPGTRSAQYWSSTTSASHPGFAWNVSFDNGMEYNGGYKGRRYFVRAVRGGIIAATVVEPPALSRPGRDGQRVEDLQGRRQPIPPHNDSEDRLEPYPLDPDAQYK